MRRKFFRSLAFLLLTVSLLLLTIDLSLYVLNRVATDRYHENVPEHWLAYARFAVVALGNLAAAGLGLLLALRRPRNPIGWLFLIGTFLMKVSSVVQQIGLYRSNVKEQVRVLGVQVDLNDLRMLDFVSTPAAILGLGMVFVVLLVLFPEGRFESRTGRAVGIVVIGLMSLTLVEQVVGPSMAQRENPLSVPWLYELIAYQVAVLDRALPLSYLAFLLTIPLAGGFFVVRLLRSHGERRLQMKWLGFAASIAAIGLIAVLVAYYSKGFFDVLLLDFSWFDWWSLVLQAGITLVPIAAAIAIFKYRLYDIEVILRRSIVFTSLAVFITAGYVIAVVALGSVVGGERRFIPSAAATGLVAIAFQPVRSRTERMANRLVYGKKAAPYEALIRMTEQMRTARPVEDILPTIAETVAAVMAARGARARLQLPSGRSVEGIWGSIESGNARVFRVDKDTVLLGEVEVIKRRGERVTTEDERALQPLLPRVALALENLRLALELQDHLEERQRQAAALQESLRRLTTADLRARLSFQREVHEAVATNLRELERLLPPNAAYGLESLHALIDQAATWTEAALEKVREIARGIFPPLLADKGLVAALEADANRYQSLDLNIDASLRSDRLQEEVESSIYFCCREAIRRFAGSGKVSLNIHRVDGSIEFEISSEGGSQLLPPGAAMDMEDRVDALGGSFVVHTSNSAGDGRSRGIVLKGNVPV